MKYIKIILLLIIVSNCDKKDSITDQTIDEFSSGTYDYAGYDNDGVAIVSGTLTIEIEDSVITGERDLTISNYIDYYPTEIGTGEIQGTINSDETILIYLNPNMVYTLYIKGLFENNLYQGNRYIITGGPADQFVGTFIATLNP